MSAIGNLIFDQLREILHCTNGISVRFFYLTRSMSAIGNLIFDQLRESYTALTG